MKLKMSTDILRLVNPGLYGTILGGYYEDVPKEDSKDFKELLCENGMKIMNELLQDEENITDILGEMKVNNVTFHSPIWYNYENDWFEFDLEVPDDVPQKIIDIVDDDFFKYIKERFGSYDGFISFMPYTKEKYLEAIYGRDLERSIAMYITYIIERMCHNIEVYQRDLEDSMNDVCLLNGWYEHEDYEMEETVC